MSLRVFQLAAQRVVARATPGASTLNHNSLQLLQKNHHQPLRSITSRAQKHKRILQQHAKGFRGRSKNCFRIAIRRINKAWQYAFRDRRRQRREWRKLWILRVQAGVRQYGLRYSAFVHDAKETNVMLNRKVLAELAANEPFSFKAVVDVVKQQPPVS